jgi:deoxyribodipyrimidine photo-lyase
MAEVHILWFRRDLRLHDNEALTLASAGNSPMLPCFVIDPWFYTHWSETSPARVRFLFESLQNLDANLRARGSRLYLLEGAALDVLKALTLQLLRNGQTPKLFFNRDVQVEYGIERDRALLAFYQQQGLEWHLGLNNFVQVDQDDRDTWYAQYYSYQRQAVHPTPDYLHTSEFRLDLSQLSLRDLKQKYGQYAGAANSYFRGGETAATATLQSFLEERYHGYHWKISQPWLTQQGATSHLSPHLTFGTLSTRRVYQQTKTRAEQLTDYPKAGFALKAFRDRLRWRDSFSQRLFFHPEIAYQNRYREFDVRYNAEALTPEKQLLFTAWQEGKTGFPLVDASMRQLRQMGWMNFRTRAMCATFLCINCGISWHHGAQHFMNCLVDGDVAIDHWQWQMQAGVTNPLSETFRIYNPNKNLEDRDANLKFIHHWLPELRRYNLARILSADYLKDGVYYPPIVDWALTRRVEGKVVSELRRQVKTRLLAEGGAEFEQALAAKVTVEKYRQRKTQQYQDYQQQLLPL